MVLFLDFVQANMYYGFKLEMVMMITNIGEGQSNITRVARVLLLIKRNLARMLLVKFQQPLALVL